MAKAIDEADADVFTEEFQKMFRKTVKDLVEKESVVRFKNVGTSFASILLWTDEQESLRKVFDGSEYFNISNARVLNDTTRFTVELE